MQGFGHGRYVPPDLEGTVSGNKLHRKRAPGVLRSDGTQTVRFELPYAVWCHTCRPHAIIAQGVRFNAVKARVGSYYSTPIWSFRLKHTACGGQIEIRTDPKNTAYAVVAGGKARDYGSSDEDRVREGEGGVPILTPEERDRRREDAFASLEGKQEEADAVKGSARRIAELYGDRERDWADPWTANKRVRGTYRHERKIRKREEVATEALKERLGTDMDVLPETEEDARRARLVDFGGAEDSRPGDVSAAASKPFYRPATSLPKAPKAKAAKADAREALRKQLVGNTRAAISPF
ncbi:DUF572-domain-containing protein [Polychaeton citri CBS 116435]|uniref:DUF572-domain-containing protein n=1 Tax=Polychaeton citri CBS 116435 TaxID=1314669 RepID=A0A9P4Q0L3_9PEZI|nr:DUF572-domain-containing protein [Polychaeton citri CBS 116435]